MNTEKLHKFLPSKKFAILIGVLVAAVVLIIVLTSLFGSHGKFNSRKSPYPLVEAKGTVSELIGQDSNQNGIADWEESLWGLDPKGDGAANKATIDQKKAANGVITNTSGDQNLTQNDQFVRTLLSTILALNQSGSLTQEAMTKLGESIGQNLQAKRGPQVPTYALKDMNSPKGAAAITKKAYFASFTPLIKKAVDAGIGTEFTVMAQGMDEGGTPDSLQNLVPIADAYSDFSKKIVAMGTPSDAVFYALSLANASADVSTALRKVSTIYTDSITGMVGMDDYLTAFDAFDKASSQMADYLK